MEKMSAADEKLFGAFLSAAREFERELRVARIKAGIRKSREQASTKRNA